MGAQVPAHFHTGKEGELWCMVCVHCGAFIAAAPAAENLAVAAEVHTCESKRKQQRIARQMDERAERAEEAG